MSHSYQTTRNSIFFSKNASAEGGRIRVSEREETNSEKKDENAFKFREYFFGVYINIKNIMAVLFFLLLYLLLLQIPWKRQSLTLILERSSL